MTRQLEAGDLVFTRGRSPLAWAIRLFTRSPGEDRTLVNHVGVVVRGGAPAQAVVVEALSRVVRRPLWAYAGSGTAVTAWRITGLTKSERERMAWKASTYLGRKYGYTKIGAHLGDWMLSRLAGRDVYAFRRLAKMERYPICSWVAEHAILEVRPMPGPEGRSPDDIWDWIQACGSEVLPLAPLA